MKNFIYIECIFLILLIIPIYTNGGKKVSSSRGNTAKTNVRPSNNNANTGINRGVGSGTNNLGSNKNFGTGSGSSFTSGRTGFKSLSSSQKAGVAGALGVAAGAYVGYKIGSARSSFHYGGHQYWYGNRYYHPTSSSKRKCVFEVDETTPNWSVKDEYDNSIVREIIFECYTYETCCGMSCCRTPTHTTHSRNHWAWWQTLLVILVLGLLFAACAFFFMKQIKKRRQDQQSSFVASSTYDDSQKPFVPTGYSDANQTGFYPTQPYPNAGAAPPYPGGYNYPPQAQGYNYPPPTSVYPPPTYQPVRTY